MKKRYVLEQFRTKVSSLYIAQTKRKYGIDVGESYDKPKSLDGRVPVCPLEKERMIVAALKHFQMLPAESNVL